MEGLSLCSQYNLSPTTCDFFYCALIHIIKIKSKKIMWETLSTSTIRWLVVPPSAAITSSSHFLYDFISLTHVVEECFSPTLLPFIEVFGFSLFHSSLKLPPRYFSRVEETLILLSFSHPLVSFAGVLQIIVLLRDPVSAKLQLSDRWLHICL